MKYQDEPISFVQAEAERKDIVTKIQEIQDWLSGRDVHKNGRRISSVTYHTEREQKCTQLTRLQQRAGFLRDWIKDYNRQHGENGMKLLVELFHAVCELQERGVEVGPRIEAVLSEIEMTLPPKTLASS
jgi:hypothetical protein